MILDEVGGSLEFEAERGKVGDGSGEPVSPGLMYARFSSPIIMAYLDLDRDIA